MDNKTLRVIPKKNYFILGIILVISIILVNYMYMWSLAYKETKLNIPILDKYMEVINYNELDDYLIENQNTIIYVSVLENNQIREFEKKFKNLLKNNMLDKDILYMDITNDIIDSNIKKEMDNKYFINLIKMSDVPTVMVFENGILKSIYSVSENDYDIDRVKQFINSIKFSRDGDING